MAPRKQQHQHDEGAVRLIVRALREIRDAIRHLTPAATGGRMHIDVAAVEATPAKEKDLMATDHSTPLSLPSTTVRAKLSVVGAKLPSGEYVPSVSWRTSDTTQLPLEAAPDDVVRDADGNPALDADGKQIPVYSTYANTPLTPEEVDALPEKVAKGTVTVSATGMADCDIVVSYSTPPVGHFAITATQADE